MCIEALSVIIIHPAFASDLVTGGVSEVDDHA